MMDITHMAPGIRRLASTLRPLPATIDVDDLTQVGLMAAADAASRFDASYPLANPPCGGMNSIGDSRRSDKFL